MPKVSIHLVTFNGEKYIPYCLSSLAEQTYKNFSVLIIDNNSHDGTPRILNEYLKNHRHTFLGSVTRAVYNTKNNGFAGAHNQAIHWTKSDYVLLVNQDVILDKTYVAALAEFLDTNKQAAAVTGMLYQWSFPSTETGNAIPQKTNRIDSLGLKLFQNHRVIELLEAEHSRERSTPQNAVEIFGVSGALPMYRRAALVASAVPLFHSPNSLSEYFDNDFFVYKEDVDLAYRLCLLGYTAYLLPEVCAWHDRSAAQKKAVWQNRKFKSSFINYHSYKNHLYFLWKNVPRQLWLRFGYKIFFYEFAKFFYLLFFETKTLFALKEVFRNLPKMRAKRRFIQKKAGKEAWRNIQPWM